MGYSGARGTHFPMAAPPMVGNGRSSRCGEKGEARESVAKSEEASQGSRNDHEERFHGTNAEKAALEP